MLSSCLMLRQIYFGIKNKQIIEYYNVFKSLKFSSHCSDKFLNIFLTIWDANNCVSIMFNTNQNFWKKKNKYQKFCFWFPEIYLLNFIQSLKPNTFYSNILKIDIFFLKLCQIWNKYKLFMSSSGKYYFCFKSFKYFLILVFCMSALVPWINCVQLYMLRSKS